MKKKILIINGHPDKKSFCTALAEDYLAGAKESKFDVQLINLFDLKFDPILHKGYRKKQELETDLKKAQELILWAEHLVFVTPIWWMGVSALMKGFIERIFVPGFAFKYGKRKFIPHKLLKGRSARLILTQGAPKFSLRILFLDPIGSAFIRGTLKFCGITPVHRTTFCRVPYVGEEKLINWRNKIYFLGKGGG